MDRGDVDFDFFDSPTDKNQSRDLQANDMPKSRDSPTPLPRPRSGVGSQRQNTRVSRSPSSDSSRSRSRSHSESNSYSSSYDSSDSNYSSPRSPKTKVVKKIEAKIPSATSDSGRKRVVKLGGRKGSGSFNSDNSDDERKNAWGEDSVGRHEENSKIAARPKTALGDKNSNGRRTKPGDSRSTRSLSETDSEYSSSYSSDSDVTDVSPLHSPRTPSSKRYSSRDESISDRARQSKPPQSPGVHREVGKHSRPTSATTSHRSNLLQPDKDGIDLRLLMQAVMEMEQRQDPRSSSRGSSHTPHFIVPHGPAPQNKKNFSFQNDKVKTIDLENQRLMQKILKYATQSKKAKKQMKEQTTRPRPAAVSLNKMTASAINRMRDQQRIERENIAMLRRLQGTKPTKTIARDDLLTDYNSQLMAGYSVAEAHPAPPRRAKAPSPYALPVTGDAFSRSTPNLRAGDAGSVTSQRSGGSAGRVRPVSAMISRRPTSAKVSSRPQSAKVGRQVSIHGSITCLRVLNPLDPSALIADPDVSSPDDQHYSPRPYS